MSGSVPTNVVASNGIGVISDAQANSYVQVGGLLANARAFNSALTGMQISLSGLTSPLDGGQGVFYWNPSSTATDDGGVTVIQPNGVLYGRWLRMTGGGAQVTSVPNIATLRGLSSGVSPVLVQGYYTPGDGGGGIYSRGVGVDNGGTIITSSNGTYVLDNFGQSISIRQFGAKGDGVTDDTVAIQAAVTAAIATFTYLLIPVGRFVVSATITGNGPITIYGVGNGAGPGVINSFGCSLILCKNTFMNGDVFAITTVYSCIFRDFQIAGALNLSFTDACPRSGGAGIHIAGITGHINAGSVIDNVTFSGLFWGIRLERCAENTLTTQTSHQAWGQYAFIAENGATAVESSHGKVTGNFFFGGPGSSQESSMIVHCGYGIISGNKFLGAQFGIKVVADQTVNIGSVMITGNSFEEIAYQDVLITTNGPVVASVQVTGNQLSNQGVDSLVAGIVVQPSLGGSGLLMYDIDISGNNFIVNTVAAAAGLIFINGLNITVARNKGRITGGSAYGVVVETGDDQTTQVLDNEWTADGGALTGDTGYLLQGNAVLRDLSSRLFTVARLPVGATDGSSVYVTDGHATDVTTFDLTVTGGGTGCVANKMSGAWLTIQV